MPGVDPMKDRLAGLVDLVGAMMADSMFLIVAKNAKA
jgi:hypothetical protein